MEHISYTCDVCKNKVGRDATHGMPHCGVTAKIQIKSVPYDLSDGSNYWNNSTHRLEEKHLCLECQTKVYNLLAGIYRQRAK